jgi:hypothetical protein
MSVFKLADDHPLTKAGLRCVHLVETAERGLRVGDLATVQARGCETSHVGFK